MALYHFDITDGNPHADAGIELASLTDARAMALQFAGSVIRDQPPSFWTTGGWEMTVSDSRRLTLFMLTVTTIDAPTLTPVMPTSRVMGRASAD